MVSFEILEIYQDYTFILPVVRIRSRVNDVYQSCSQCFEILAEQLLNCFIDFIVIKLLYGFIHENEPQYYVQCLPVNGNNHFMIYEIYFYYLSLQDFLEIHYTTITISVMLLR